MKRNIYKRIFSLILTILFLTGFLPSVLAEEEIDRMKVVKDYIDTVLENGRYIEGSKYPELFVMGLNSDTLEPVEWVTGGKTYYPSNFFSMQNFLSTLVGYSNLTDDPKYKEIAKKQMKLWFDNFTDKNGLVYAGAHTFVDAKTGEVVSLGNQHEMKNNSPYYELMWEVDPDATIKYMEAFWNAHILDWSNLSMNRHGKYDREMGNLWDSEYTDESINFKQDGIAYQSTGNDLIEFALFISEKTGDKKPEEWALRLLKKYIDVTHPDTGLSGAQYGELSTGDTTYKKYGAEFGDKAKTYNYVDSNAIATTAGYTPLVLLPYYEKLSDEERAETAELLGIDILDYVVKCIEGVARVAYDAETNKLKTPMWSDGADITTLTPAQYQDIEGPLLSAAIYAYKLSKSEKIWTFARNMAMGYGLGDIGTAPGENVELNMNTSARSSTDFSVMISLYKQTGEQAYLDFAKKIGDNALKYEKRNNNLFMKKNSRYNAQITDSNASMFMSLEAALDGKFDIIPSGGRSSGIDMNYDGYGRITSANAIFNKTRTYATDVTLEQEDVTLVLSSSNDFADIEGHSAEIDIKALSSLGFIDGRGDGSFAPNENITRAEILDYCSRICGKDAEIADSNLPQQSDSYINKEELASVLVKTLMCKNTNKTYTACGTLSQFDDSGDIAEWAREYADIAANYYLVNKRGDESFSPKHIVTRGEAATAIKKLSDLCELDVKRLSFSVSPEGATEKTAVYTSSNSDVVAVDEDGRIFPISVGEAVITAKVGAALGSCKVNVVPYEDRMLKSIEIDGIAIDDFSPLKTEYTHKLLVGTTDIPKVTASSYSGEAVTVIMPKVIPGVAKIYVQGESENAYMVSLLPDKINYAADESFDSFMLGISLHDIISDKVTWGLHSSAQASGASPAKIVEHPVTTQGYGRALSIPYNKSYQMQFSGRFFESPYITGANAESDSVIVVEYDLMTTETFNGLSVMLGDHTADGNTWAIVQNYTDDKIKLHNNSTVGTYKPNEVHRIKLVIDKKSLKSNVFFNGDKILSGQAPKVVTSRISYFMINAYSGLDTNATVYVDNVKIYELPVNEDTVYNFYDLNDTAITRIGDELTVSFKSELGEAYDDVQLICAIYTPEGKLKRVELADAKIEATSPRELSTSVRVDDMENGDFLCVYTWTKELCPIIVQKLIYKC